MFKNLTENLSSVIRNLKGKGRLSSSNIKDTLRQVRLALLEADVALSVVKIFIERIREKAIGKTVEKSLTPGQSLVKLIQSELTSLLGNELIELEFKAQPPFIILLAGMQGSGKTTTAAKLAYLIKKKYKKRVMLVSTDIYRHAAIFQLKTLAKQIGVMWCESTEKDNPKEIIKRSLNESKKLHADVLIVDTAGRLHIDEIMMKEISIIQQKLQPNEIFFVIDCMAGQDAVNLTKTFNEKINITGIILTKTDGDARGGVALSAREITGKAIRFVGVGEKIEDFEIFYPDRMASRILGMGDMLSLIDDIEEKVNKEETLKVTKKLKKGSRFTLVDYRSQLEQMLDMGNISEVLMKLPLDAKLNSSVIEKNINEQQIKRQIAIIDSMTLGERKFPKTINGSRKKRIAKGSGQQIQIINRLLKQFLQMERMMKKLSGKGMNRFMNRFLGDGSSSKFH